MSRLREGDTCPLCETHVLAGGFEPPPALTRLEVKELELRFGLVTASHIAAFVDAERKRGRVSAVCTVCDVVWYEDRQGYYELSGRRS